MIDVLVSARHLKHKVPPFHRSATALQSHRNLGLLRVALFVIGPLTVGLIISIFLHWSRML